MADRTGDTQAVMATLNASSHSKGERGEQDYYATPPYAVIKLLDKELFDRNILEPACGEGHISNLLLNQGYYVKSYDIIDRGYGEVADYLGLGSIGEWNGDIITNPPFSLSQGFVEKSMNILQDGHKLALLLRIQFLEGVKRNKMFKKYPPKKIYVFSRNIRCAKNGDFEHATGNASTYCWFIREKGYIGSPTIDWII